MKFKFTKFKPAKFKFMNFKLNFSVKVSLAISIFIFLLIFAFVYFQMNNFYSKAINYTKNVLKTLNKGFKIEYFEWLTGSINDYGKQILSSKEDEFKFFKDIIEPNLYGISAYNIYTNVYDYIASVFYWNGKEVFSQDPFYKEDTNLLRFLKTNDLKVGESMYYLDYERNDFIYLYKLNKGIIGGKIYVDVLNRDILRSVFMGIKLNFYSGIAKSLGDEVNFVSVIEEFEGAKVSEVYKVLISEVKDFKEAEVVGEVIGGSICFLLVQDYGEVKFFGVIELPLRGIFPLSIFESSLLVSLPVVIVLFVVMVFVFGRAFKEYKEFSTKLREISSSGGDLAFRVESKLGIEEVREVVDNFNKFLSNIEVLVRSVKDTFSDIEDSMGVFGDINESIESIKVLVGRQDEVRSMIDEINAMVGEVSSTVEEMMRSIEVVSGNVSKQYGMMEEMSGMVEEVIMTVSSIGKRVSKANEVLSSLRDEALRGSEEVRRNVEEVRDVNMFLGNVLEVVNVIKAIADRIEVLSMNAGIEAAHAGERGRGFAVVAEEMGNLAEDSRKKADEVGKIIKDVIERVKVGIEGVEENGEKFVKVADGIREVSAFVGEIDASMAEVGKTNEMLMGVITNLMSYSDSIRVGIEEDKVGMEEIVKAVYEVSEAVNGLNDKFGETYTVLRNSIEVMSDASIKINFVLDSLKKLGEELGKFKVSEVRFSKGITLVE